MMQDDRDPDAPLVGRSSRKTQQTGPELLEYLHLILLKNPRSCIIRMSTRRDPPDGGERVTTDVGFEPEGGDEVYRIIVR